MLKIKNTQNSLPRLWNANYIKVWSANFMIFFSFMLVTPILPIYLSDTFGAGKHTIGIVLSGYTIVALFSRMFSGYFVDRYNRKTVLLLSYGIFATFFLGYIIGGSLILFAFVRTFHGAPFGTVTVSNSTVAIDVLDSKRRAEGIGYYGLSNNLATAISPTVGLYLYNQWNNFEAIFLLSFIMATLGVIIDSTVHINLKEKIEESKSEIKISTKSNQNQQNQTDIKLKRRKKLIISFDRFFIVKGWSLGIMLACLSFSYGVIATYIAIYTKEQLNMPNGAATFFFILSICLMLSRLTGSRSLRKGNVVHNATFGISLSVFSYILFASLHNAWGIFGCAIILGLGNGHMFPAVQTMFVNLAPHTRRGIANSSMLTSWDLGFGGGVLLGGIISEHMSYNATFWAAAIVNIIGVILYFSYVRNTYLKNKIR